VTGPATPGAGRGSGMFLGLETSTPLGGVALAGSDGLAAERALGITGSHAARLMTAVDAVLGETGLKLADLAGIGVSVGPGSFTGLRVGVATAQGLARGAGLPLFAVPSLEAVAWGLPAAWLAPGAVVAVAMTARRGEVYGAVYAAGDGRLTALIAPVVAAPDDFAADLAALETPVCVAGTAAAGVAAGAARRGAPATAAPALFACPRAAVVAWRAIGMAAAGEADTPATLVPRYLAASQAEIKADLKARREARARGAS
jgi:tRNA threonylcarbamoyladenosine biosynthesis protein TsaB